MKFGNYSWLIKRGCGKGPSGPGNDITIRPNCIIPALAEAAIFVSCRQGDGNHQPWVFVIREVSCREPEYITLRRFRNMTTKMYTVEGMMCDGCVATVKSALKALPGVIEAQVQLTAPQAIVSMHEEMDTRDLEQAVSAAGNYRVSDYEERAPAGEAKHHPGKSRKLLGFLMPKKDCCR